MARYQDKLLAVIRLLTEGKIDQAREVATTTYAAIESRRKAAEREAENLKREAASFGSVLQEIQAAAKTRTPAQLIPPRVSKETKPVERPAELDDEALVRMQILKAAENLAHRSNGGTISVQSAVKAAQDAGLRLKPKARTQVGNMLWKAKDKWERIGAGVYKLREIPSVFS